MTQVKATIKYVMNLGNFESMHVEVGLEDAQRENESLDEAFERVYNFVEKKIVEKSNEIQEDIKRG
jgi:ASC-1-like (ASCH) protein